MQTDRFIKTASPGSGTRRAFSVYYARNQRKESVFNPQIVRGQRLFSLLEEFKREKNISSCLAASTLSPILLNHKARMCAKHTNKSL
jgi:hypothetical protein